MRTKPLKSTQVNSNHPEPTDLDSARKERRLLLLLLLLAAAACAVRLRHSPGSGGAARGPPRQGRHDGGVPRSSLSPPPPPLHEASVALPPRRHCRRCDGSAAEGRIRSGGRIREVRQKKRTMRKSR
uniref:Uncharacterized protein n=1 Tax=Oryza barthii TaxID=65489 RepID=A0A0D3GXF9_9ORYZ